MTTLIIEPKNSSPQDCAGRGDTATGVSEPVIKNTGFFPDVDSQRVREEMRLEQTVSPRRLRRAIKTAIAETNAELRDWRDRQLDAPVTPRSRMSRPTSSTARACAVSIYFNAVCVY